MAYKRLREKEGGGDFQRFKFFIDQRKQLEGGNYKKFRNDKTI